MLRNRNSASDRYSMSDLVKDREEEKRERKEGKKKIDQKWCANSITEYWCFVES